MSNPFFNTFDTLSRHIGRAVEALPSFRWASVTQAQPLRVLVDGDVEALPVSPVCLVGGVGVGSRVLVLFHGRRVIVLGAAGGGGVPVGVIVPFAGVVVPYGWLACDGATYDKSAFPVLAAVLGATGTGASFQVPDLRGRVPMGAGVAAVNTDNSWGKIQGSHAWVVGKRVGEYQHALNVSELAAHKHTIVGTGAKWGNGAGVYASNVGAGSGWEIVSNWTAGANYLDTKTEGGGKGHNNVQPALIVNFIIKT